MRAKIGSQLLARIKPAERHYEICDTELKGFTLRIQPSGVMSFVVRYRKEDGKTTRPSLASRRCSPLHKREMKLASFQAKVNIRH